MKYFSLLQNFLPKHGAHPVSGIYSPPKLKKSMGKADAKLVPQFRISMATISYTSAHSQRTKGQE
jgi:hypothetical protein